MLIAQDCVKFARAGRGRIARQRFLVNDFADFPDVVRVKKSRFCSVIGVVWNLATSPIPKWPRCASKDLYFVVSILVGEHRPCIVPIMQFHQSIHTLDMEKKYMYFFRFFFFFLTQNIVLFVWITVKIVTLQNKAFFPNICTLWSRVYGFHNDPVGILIQNTVILV